MADFWASCGYHLLGRTDEGQLVITDDYLRAYFDRPELAIVAESCQNERMLHDRLLTDPRAHVTEEELTSISDDDARENYRIVLRFRSQLLSHSTLESSYFDIFSRDIAAPPSFIHELTQLIVRGALEGTRNGLEARAGELFFRAQSVNVHHGAVLLADAETVKRQADDAALGNVGRFLRELQAPLRSAELDVLDEPNHAEYFSRDERHDLVLDLHPEGAGAAAFAVVLERWIAHLHAVRVTVRPIREIPDEEWVWHVGLDVEATGILNDIYNGAEADAEKLKRVIGLFRMDFQDAAAMRPELKGAPVFLGLAMTPQATLRMKPQNLLMNLPLARRT